MRNQNFAYDIILTPIITEKSTNMSSLNKVTFKVSRTASKTLIKKSIEKLYKVNVVKINTLNSKDRTKIVKGRIAKKSGYKKAIITLKEGQSIDIAAGI
jgi:large subunit ribosomal protein L23